MSAVGTYPMGTTREGVLDLSGNVWEWCLNEFKNPEWVEAGGRESRVLRGGSWSLNHKFARAVNRGSSEPDDRCSDIGFRVVCSPPIR